MDAFQDSVYHTMVSVLLYESISIFILLAFVIFYFGMFLFSILLWRPHLVNGRKFDESRRLFFRHR